MAATERTVAVIGLGEMGLPMALNLLASGFRVAGFDLRDGPVQALRAAGGRAAGSGREAAAGAAALVVMVRTAAQVEALLLGDEGVLHALEPGALLIVTSTVGLSCVRRLADASGARGVAFVDAPVSGGRARAENGTLTVIAGGAPEDVERARPVLAAVGSRLVHVGGVGAGTTVKLVNQVLLTAGVLAAREMTALARAGHVPVETAWDAVRTCTGASWVLENWPVAVSWVDGYRPGGALDLLVKDTGLAMDMAREEGVPAPLLGLTAQLVRALARDLGG